MPVDVLADRRRDEGDAIAGDLVVDDDGEVRAPVLVCRREPPASVDHDVLGGDLIVRIQLEIRRLGDRHGGL